MPTIDLRRLNTVHVVPPSPFSPDGEQLLPERLTERVAALAAAGIRVFLPAAGTGEFHSLSEDEVVACVRATRAGAGSSAIVIAPIGFAPYQTVAQGKRLLDAGADLLLLMPTIHPYVSDAGYRDYFRFLSQRLGTALLTYKRGPAPSDRMLLELAREGLLCGVKYAVNDLDAFSHFVAGVHRDQLPVGLFCGTAERWAPYFMLAGATGYTSGAGCVAPRVTLELHLRLAAGKNDEAVRWFNALRPLEDFRAREADSLNISAIKYAVSRCGVDFGPVRPPQRTLTEDERRQLDQLVAELLAVEAQALDNFTLRR